MATSTDCVLCQLVRGALPSSRVVETDAVVALMDIDPVTPGHVLVVTREHLPALADLPDALAAEVVLTARNIAVALRRSPLRCEGVNLFYADGVAAFQEIPHAHLHVIARYRGDGFTLNAA